MCVGDIRDTRAHGRYYLYGGSAVELVDVFGLVVLEPEEGAAAVPCGEVEVRERAGQGRQVVLGTPPILKISINQSIN